MITAKIKQIMPWRIKYNAFKLNFPIFYAYVKTAPFFSSVFISRIIVEILDYKLVYGKRRFMMVGTMSKAV